MLVTRAMSTEAIVAETAFFPPRRWPRYKLDLPVRVIAEKRGKTTIVQARGNELNEGGLALFAGTELNEGDLVAVEFTPPYSGDPIRVRCTVRNRKGYMYGLEFLTATIEDNENVEQIRFVLRGLGSPIR